MPSRQRRRDGLDVERAGDHAETRSATTAMNVMNANGMGVTTVVAVDVADRQCSKHSAPDASMSPVSGQAAPIHISEPINMPPPCIPKIAIPANVANENRMEARRNERRARFIPLV